MPPAESPNSTPALLPEKSPKNAAIGPTAGIVVILFLVIVGAFYFWGHALNQRDQNPPPYIPGDVTTT